MSRAVGGRVVAAANIHLTLAFLGSVAQDRLDELRAIGTGLHTGDFELELARSGCWKRAAVGWVAPAQTPAPLQALVTRLGERLFRAGFSLDGKPFAAHVTVVRKTKCTADAQTLLATLPLTLPAWRVRQLSLVRSVTFQTGPVYTPIAEWPLS